MLFRSCIFSCIPWATPGLPCASKSGGLNSLTVPMRKLMAATALAGLLTVTCAADTMVCDAVCSAATSAPHHGFSTQSAEASPSARSNAGHLNRHHHPAGNSAANQDSPAAALDRLAGLHRVIHAPNCTAYDQVLSLRASSNARLIKGPVAVLVDSNPALIEGQSGTPQRTASPGLELGSPPRVSQLRI